MGRPSSRYVALAAVFLLAAPLFLFVPVAAVPEWPGPDGRADPLLLVHGWAPVGSQGFDVQAYFDVLGQNLVAKGWDARFLRYYGCDWNGADISTSGDHHFHFYPNQTNGDPNWATYHASSCGGNGHNKQTPIEHLAYHLAWYIKDTFTSQNQCVRIVAHSMGGVVVRYAIAQAGRDLWFPDRICVREVVTLSSPHGAAPWYGRILSDYQAYELSHPDSTLMEWLAANGRHPNGQTPTGAASITRWTNVGSYGDWVVHAASAVDMHWDRRIMYPDLQQCYSSMGGAVCDDGQSLGHSAYLNAPYNPSDATLTGRIMENGWDAEFATDRAPTPTMLVDQSLAYAVWGCGPARSGDAVGAYAWPLRLGDTLTGEAFAPSASTCRYDLNVETGGRALDILTTGSGTARTLSIRPPSSATVSCSLSGDGRIRTCHIENAPAGHYIIDVGIRDGSGALLTGAFRLWSGQLLDHCTVSGDAGTLCYYKCQANNRLRVEVDDLAGPGNGGYPAAGSSCAGATASCQQADSCSATSTTVTVGSATGTCTVQTSRTLARCTLNTVRAPQPPQDVSGRIGDGRNFLSWSMPAADGGKAITNYNIFRSTSTGSSGSQIASVPGTQLTFTDVGLANGQAYFYKVVASNNNAQGDLLTNPTDPSLSGDAALPYGLIPQAVPTGPMLTASPGDHRVDLSWPDTGALVYGVWKGTSSNQETFLWYVGSSRTFTDWDVQNGQTYYYQVQGWNAAGFGPYGPEASATPLQPGGVPSEPRNLQASAGNGQVSLSWDPPTNQGGSSVTGYRVYRSTSSNGQGPTPISSGTCTNPVSSTSCTDTGRTNGDAYYYKVAAVNGIGTGPQSNEAQATPRPDQTTPSAPRNLQATPGDAQVSLAWDPPASDGGSSVTGYRIYRGTAPNGEGSTPISSGTCTNPVATTSCTDTERTNDITYYYKVAAVNGIGTGAQSNEASATPRRAQTVPGEPQGLQASGGDRQVSLSWSAPASDGGSGVTGYRIYRSTIPNGQGSTPISSGTCTNPVAATSCTDSGRTNGVTYYYKVAAVNAVGTGAQSGEAAGTPAEPGATTCNASGDQPSCSFSCQAGDEIHVIGGTTQSSGAWPHVTATCGGVTTGCQAYMSCERFSTSLATSSGTGTCSSTTSATTIQCSAYPPRAPGAPRNVAVRAVLTQLTALEVSWSPPSDDGSSGAIRTYWIWRGTSCTSLNRLTEVDGSIRTYTDYSAGALTAYCYAVTAKGFDGREGAKSPTATGRWPA